MKYVLSVVCLIVLGLNIHAGNYQRIIIRKDAHPAVRSAAEILARKLNIPVQSIIEQSSLTLPTEGDITMDCGKAETEQLKFLSKDPQTVDFDGYLIKFDGNRALVFGKRPRSLLYAAGDLHWWKDRTSGLYVRQPAFEHRNSNIKEENIGIADMVATLGVNVLFFSRMSRIDFVTLEDKFPEIFNALSKEEQDQLHKHKEEAIKASQKYLTLCHNADVDYYPFIYGNDIARWSPEMMKAIYKVYPKLQGERALQSWEKASLCPSEPKTWEIIEAYMEECSRIYNADGFFVTFWDWYGIYCQCDRCKASGMNTFPEQLKKCLGQYYEAMSRLGKPVIVRTWASGVGHWTTIASADGVVENQWVHAPGYGGFSGSPQDIWGKVISDVPAGLSLQIKSYYSDCFPDARYNPLIGNTGKHKEIVEYQITGQTTGKFYFPASNVYHTSSTMKKNLALIGKNGGVSLFWGATGQGGFNLFNDIANSMNLFAWKEFSWDVNADPDKVWNAWAEPIYGKEASPFIIRLLKASEAATTGTFSVLGFGSDTNSGFSGNVYTREVRLMYTNRHYLPEYRKFLEPTTENIDRVIKQKNDVMLTIDTMKLALNNAKPFLKPEQYSELSTRVNWLSDIASAWRELDVSLWRLRYLRYLYEMRTTDPQQMKEIAKSYDNIAALRKTMFKYEAGIKFSCYNQPLGESGSARGIGLGNPESLMHDIYAISRGYVEDIVGPNYLPSEWVRKEVIRPNELAAAGKKPVDPKKPEPKPAVEQPAE
jgi:hypothetical protein